MKYTVHIKPNSRKTPSVEQGSDGSLIVSVREPAVEGKANDALIVEIDEVTNVGRHTSALRKLDYRLDDEPFLSPSAAYYRQVASIREMRFAKHYSIDSYDRG